MGVRLMPYAEAEGKPQFAGMGMGGSGDGSSYTLPVASASTLGGVKVGSGLSITESGVLSASGGGGGSFTTETVTSETYNLGGNDQNEKTIDISKTGYTPFTLKSLYCINEYDTNYTQQVSIVGWYIDGNSLKVIIHNNFSSNNTCKVKATVIYQ